MSQFNLLNEKGIKVTEINNLGEELRAQWEKAFTKDLSRARKNMIHF